MTNVKPPIPGLIHDLADTETNTHPYPILVHPLWFRTMCIECGGNAAGPYRSTIALALVDREVHARSHQ